MLTDDEISFLASIGKNSQDVFDGQRFSPKKYKTEAKQYGQDIVIGAFCRKAGHRLRTRSNGSCIQCDPRQLAYQQRDQQSGYVYIAQSHSLNLLKIGFTKDLAQRETGVRKQNSGQATDWKISYHVFHEIAAKVERSVGERLNSWRLKITYDKENRSQEASEIYVCEFQIAKAAIDDSVVAIKA